MPVGPRWLAWLRWGNSHKPKEKQEAESRIQASPNHGTLSRGASLAKGGGTRASGTKWSRRSFKKRPITIQEVNEIECQLEQECVQQLGTTRTPDSLEPVFSHHTKVSSFSQRASGTSGEERRPPGGGRPTLSVKKVAPPTVPDPPITSHRLSGSSFGSGGSTSTESSVFTSASAGSGSGSIGYCSAEPQDNRSSLGLDEAYYPAQGYLDMNKSEGFSGRSLPSPSHISRAPLFTYPGTQLPGKLKGQLSPPGMMEDQGIDMTQSPGRESPSGSTGSSSTGGKTGESCRVLPLPGCRNSTTSLDSGRASADHRHPSTSSTCTTASSGPSLLGPGPAYRLSGQSYESMRHSYHSSSSSLGSGRIEDVHRLNAVELLSQGVPEHEVLNAWLTDLGLEDYYDLFVRAGYDMHTITRMTPEDLTAIGVKKPNHRKQLKSEIALLNIPDGLPEFIPDTLEEWLSLLGLAEYSPSFRRQGYRTVEDVAQLTWEDLDDFGIVRLGHQKKITLAIKRVKDILSGKWVPPPPTNSIVQSQCYTQDVVITTHAPPSPSDVAPPCPFPELSSFSRPSHYDVPRPLIHSSSTAPTRTLIRPLVSDTYSHYGHSRMLHPTHTYQPDVVAIQVHERAPQPSVFNTFNLRPRSYDDGDLVPKHTHNYPVHHTEQYHGGTLPRPKGTVKPRPVAKITAKTRLDSSSDPDQSDMVDCAATHGVEYDKQPLQHYAGFHSKLGMKPPPPPPPKRAQSMEDETSGKSSKILMDDPHPLPPPPDNLSVLSYSEDSEDFPPPPAPMSASELMQHSSSTTVAASVRERLDTILQRNGAQWPSKIYGSPAHFNPASHPAKTYPGWNPNQESNNCRERSPADSHDSEENDEFRQRRNGSDASFKSTSSTESESMPFANDNAGTIKQRLNRPHPALAMVSCNSPLQSPALSRKTSGPGWRPLEKPPASASSTTDVLSDIDNMLAGLTDELDAMLEEEKSAAASATTTFKK